MPLYKKEGDKGAHCEKIQKEGEGVKCLEGDKGISIMPNGTQLSTDTVVDTWKPPSQFPLVPLLPPPYVCLPVFPLTFFSACIHNVSSDPLVHTYNVPVAPLLRPPACSPHS